jgi:isopentenyl phosphate kinase
VVVHGAGSFGHFEASQYGITKPHSTPQHTLLEGFAKTRASVTRLNHLVVSALVAAGVPAVGLSPFGSCFCANGVLSPDWQQGYVDAVHATLCR